MAVPVYERILQLFEAEGIHTGIHYPIPVHLQKAYTDLGYTRGDFPVAEALCRTVVSLPMFPELTEQEIDQVTSSVRNAAAATPSPR